MLDNLPRGTICIEDMEIGMVRYLQKQISDRDIQMFAEASGDHNPVHLDEDYAQATVFQGRVAHGMLTASLISAVIGEQLPGHGAVYLAQSLKFMAPVRPGDLVRAAVQVTAIDHARRRVTLETLCAVGDTVVLKGEALVLAPSRKFDQAGTPPPGRDAGLQAVSTIGRRPARRVCGFGQFRRAASGPPVGD